MNYIFDFDGTLCDSFGVTIKIINDYFRKVGKEEITPTLFREEGIEEIIKKYKFNKVQLFLYVVNGRRQLSKYIDSLKTYPGLPEVLMKLSQKDNLYIISTNSKKNIERFLEINKIKDYFKAVYTSPFLMNKSKKIQSIKKYYKMQSSDTFYIGDEVRDIKAARASEVKSISVAWGFEGKKLLSLHHPDFLVTKPRELLFISLTS